MLNIYGVRLVAIINNTGVLFEILGMFVFALVLMAFHNHQGFHVVTNSAGFHVGPSSFLASMFMSLYRGELLHRLRDRVPARGRGGDLRLPPVDPGRDDQALLLRPV